MEFGNLKITAFKNSKTTKNEITGVQYYTEHIYEVALDENAPSLHMANQIGLNEKNSENYAFAAAKIKDGFSKALIVKTTRVNDNFNIILTTLLNSVDQFINLNYGKNHINHKGCGQVTVDCLEDVYLNHNWVSVWATVQNAFLPATALALAGSCAASEC